MTASTPQRSPVLVREATPADLAAATDLARAAGLPLDGLARAAVVLVADAGGKVVGTIALERHVGSDGQITFLLRSAAVQPDQQRRGIGEELTRAALDVVDGVGATVGLLTETAADYFLRFGFVDVPRDDLPPALAASPELQGACPASATAMLRTARQAQHGHARAPIGQDVRRDGPARTAGERGRHSR